MSEQERIDLETIVKLCEQAITKEIWLDNAECTRRLKLVYSNFAQGLGYQTELEFLTIDIVWWSNGRMVAAIESENDPRTDPIANEWRRLVYTDADNKILVSYCTDKGTREEWLKRAEQTVAANPRSKDSHYYLILGDQNHYRFRGYEFDNKGQRTHTHEIE